MNSWKPKEIIINRSVENDPVTKYFLNQCPNVPIRIVKSGKPEVIKEASKILKEAGNKMIDIILAGKKVVYIAPASGVVDTFTIRDTRLACPHFERLKLASNGCFFQCDWCYLKLTFRGVYPYITVRAEYPKIKVQLEKRLSQTIEPIFFNSGELADSLSLDHLTGAGQAFIPWFGNTRNGYLFMLTKTDQVETILDLKHNRHTILAWSLNTPEVSRKFEIGAPPFDRRLKAARKAQDAGYPIRVRLDPIVPVEDWKEKYAETIKNIFDAIQPERITLGTLRFEEGFYKLRNTLFTSGPFLPRVVGEMEGMFPPKDFPGSKLPKIGKYSFPEERRIKMFKYIIKEVKKHSDCPIALCKEDRQVWKAVGLNLRKCRCVCQLDYADMTQR